MYGIGLFCILFTWILFLFLLYALIYLPLYIYIQFQIEFTLLGISIVSYLIKCDALKQFMQSTS